ncbi:MAG: hypothetical protein ONB45_17195 [candidate division KSB1 bacterium]|nr:hypothetical protein [candidate division KSB1 bacterium]
MFLFIFANPLIAQSGKIYIAVLFNNTKSNISGSDRYVGVFTRENNNRKWRNIYHPNLFTFGLGYFQSATTQRLYIAAGNGLHRSSDGGKTWKLLTGWEIMEVLSVAPDPVDSNVIYVATPYGIFKSTDDGKSWAKKMRGFKTWFTDEVLIDRRDHRTLYAAAEDDLYRSTDGAEHWSSLKVGVSGIRTVFQHPTSFNVILVGTEDHGVRVSLDNGKSWKAGTGIPAAAIYAIHASSDGKAIYAGGYKTGLWKSEDMGQSWQQIWAAPEAEAIYSLFVNPTDPNHLMVGTNGKGIYESFDKGKTWRPAGLDGAHVKQIVHFPFL